MFARRSLTFVAHSSQRTARYATGSLWNRPAPPALSPKEQREFEELVRAAAAPAAASDSKAEEAALAQAHIADGDELHPDTRRVPTPEFEGATNPITGEVGGPKREPVRYGEWSFGGRALDF